jgi:cell division septation protein DedD
VDAEHVARAVDDLKLAVGQSLRAPFEDQPGGGLASFPEEFRDTSTEHEDEHRPPPQDEGFRFFSDAPARMPGVAPDIGRSPLSLSSTGLGSQLDETRGGDFLPEAAVPKPAIPAIEEDFVAADRRRRNRLLALVGVWLAVATSLVGYWFSSAPTSRRQSDVLVQPAEPRRPVQTPRGEAIHLSPLPEGKVTGSQNPPSTRTDTNVSPSQTVARYALQMATFQSPARAAQALQEFRDAGYHAYSIEVSLRDGERAFAVFLGPYADPVPAERDLDRARQMPGYGSGRLVQLDPSFRPPILQP